MTDIYRFRDYKEFVLEWVQAQPKKGYGQFKKMADHLGVGTVFISQVFKGDRHFSEEQAFELSLFLNLLENETRYFVTLVRFARAGTKKLQVHIQQELARLSHESKELKNRIRSDKDLDDASKAIFYSDWFYSAIRLATDIKGLRDVAELSARFNLPIEKVKDAVEFLLKTGLCEWREGELRMGPKIVFLSNDSPHIMSRQRSWRIRAFQKMETANRENLFFTCPLVCSHATAESLRRKILGLIDEVLHDVKESPSEELACLNIDWFRV